MTKYWLWISLKPISVRVLHKVIDNLGTVQDVYDADIKALISAGANKEQAEILSQKSLKRAEIVQEMCKSKNIKIVTMDDEDYPDRLINIDLPPLVLYIRGVLPNLDTSLPIAIVGTRSFTEYGHNITESLVSRLAEAGVIIVSGMAKGIDTVANRAALQAGGKTIAVLGSGVDVCYPSENAKLMEQIVQNGAVISEYPPGTDPIASHFPMRNRIISGLSVAVVVTEAPVRSGSLITAQYAIEQGKEVFAIPGNIYQAESAGCNNLIKDGAQLATTPWDIVEAFQGTASINFSKLRTNISKIQRTNKSKKTFIRTEKVQNIQNNLDKIEKTQKDTVKDHLNLSNDEMIIVEVVKNGADSADSIIAHCNLPVSTVMANITMLEINGILKRENGRIRVSYS